jgi:hypothetical protein
VLAHVILLPRVIVRCVAGQLCCRLYSGFLHFVHL